MNFILFVKEFKFSIKIGSRWNFTTLSYRFEWTDYVSAAPKCFSDEFRRKGRPLYI